MSAVIGWPLAAAVVAAVIPAALLWARRGAPPPAPRLSPGRFFLLYAATYAALLVGVARLGPGVPLLLVGLAWGFLGGGRGAATLHRLLYGAAWHAAHPDAARRDARRWQMPLMLAAVAAFTAAMILGR